MTTVDLFVDGEQETPKHLGFATPRVVHSFTVPGEAGVRRVLGAWGFGITIVGPSERLLAAHAERRACEVTLRSEWLELGPIVVVFDQRIESISGPVLFGHSPHGDDPPRWEEIPS